MKVLKILFILLAVSLLIVSVVVFYQRESDSILTSTSTKISYYIHVIYHKISKGGNYASVKNIISYGGQETVNEETVYNYRVEGRYEGFIETEKVISIKDSNNYLYYAHLPFKRKDPNNSSIWTLDIINFSYDKTHYKSNIFVNTSEQHPKLSSLKRGEKVWIQWSSSTNHEETIEEILKTGYLNKNARDTDMLITFKLSILPQ